MKIAGYLLVSIMVLGMATQGSAISQPKEPVLQSDTFSGYINIASDADLATYSSSGDGTSASTPYMLDPSLFVDKFINISSTTAYFVIDGFYFQDYSYTNRSAIILTDTVNGVISNSDFDIVFTGITAIRSNNIKIENNTMYTFSAGINLGAVLNSQISGNSIEAPNPIYFNYLEREYAENTLGSAVPSQNLIFKDNRLINGGIDGFFQITYEQDIFFSHTFDNNTFVVDYNGVTDEVPIMIIEDGGDISIQNQNIGQLLVLNASSLMISNSTFYSNIYTYNVPVVDIDQLNCSNVLNRGYLSDYISFFNGTTVSITNSYIASIWKNYPAGLMDQYLNNVSDYENSYELYLKTFVKFTNVTDITLSNNIIDAGFSTQSQLVSLNNYTTAEISSNEFLTNVTSSNIQNLYLDEKGLATIYNNGFYAAQGSQRFYYYNKTNTVFDYNYYGGYSNVNDTDHNGILDEPYWLNEDAVFWDTTGDFWIFDQHARLLPHDILNFSITPPGGEISGLVNLTWSGVSSHDLPVTYSLWYQNGSEWKLVNNLINQHSYELNTTKLYNGVGSFNLTATQYSQVYNTTQTRFIEFDLNINNSGGVEAPPITTPVVTTIIEPGNTTTEISTLISTITESIHDTITETVAQSLNYPFLWMTAVVLIPVIMRKRKG